MNCKDNCANYEGCIFAEFCECVMCCIEYTPKEKDGVETREDN